MKHETEISARIIDFVIKCFNRGNFMAFSVSPCTLFYNLQKLRNEEEIQARNIEIIL